MGRFFDGVSQIAGAFFDGVAEVGGLFFDRVPNLFEVGRKVEFHCYLNLCAKMILIMGIALLLMVHGSTRLRDDKVST